MKRKATDITKEVYKAIKENPDITMSQLERKIGTNPSSLKEHCKLLEYFGLIQIKKEENTRRLRVRQ
ncbi:winged helix-turn-helix transcriptional regulator [Candidatus Woesearchaeota archaeon]|nr:winged helix-turn-helix transcriptional regulator [Candidatus Woesearchaeota archaeon]